MGAVTALALVPWSAKTANRIFIAIVMLPKEPIIQKMVKKYI
jgi:hypothetical protein